MDGPARTSGRRWRRRSRSRRTTGAIFELVFDRFFFRAAEAAAVEVGVKESDGAPGSGSDSDEIDLDTLRQQIAAALRDGSEAALRDLARLAIAAFGRAGRGLGRHRRRRAAHPPRARPARRAAAGPRRGRSRAATALPRDQLRRFEELLRRELERQQIERTETLPPTRPLNELDRALPSGPLQDLAAVHRVVAQLKRRLKTQGQESRGHRRHAHVDVRRTMRASLETGGVPVAAALPPEAPAPAGDLRPVRRVARRVTSASVFFLSVLHALHDSFRKMRSFVFIERISEVTDVFVRERDFANVSEAIAKDAGVADVSGYTDYGRVWSEFRDLVEDDLHPRATVIVLGDARTNGRDPRADVFAPGRRAAGPHVLAQPRAAAVLELRRLGHLGLRAALRGLRVLDDGPARGLRQGARAARRVLGRAAAAHRRHLSQAGDRADERREHEREHEVDREPARAPARPHRDESDERRQPEPDQHEDHVGRAGADLEAACGEDHRRGL